MGLFDFLAGPSRSFNFNDSISGFEAKLREKARHGNLQNLADNLDSVIAVLRDYAPYIRRGGLDRGQRLRVWLKIKHLEGNNLSREDERDIKKLVEHFGK